MQKAEGQRRLVTEGEKACEGKERKVSRAIGVKFLWKKNTLSMSVILPARSCQPRRTRRVKQHFIDGSLRRRKLRQRRASRISSWHIWDVGEDSPSWFGNLRDAPACPIALPINSRFSRNQPT